MKEFITAGKRDIGTYDEDEAIRFKHDDTECVFFQPSDTQLAIMLSMGRRDMGAREAGTFISLFFEMMDSDTQRYFETRMLDREDTFELGSDGGVMDIFEYLAGEWSARPTKQPSDYQPPRRATGRASTANTPAKALTSSRSRSRVSSQ